MKVGTSFFNFYTLEPRRRNNPNEEIPVSEPHCVQKQPYSLELEAGDYWWCACGLSKNQPMCDGSHKNNGFQPLRFSLQQKSSVSLCGCKRSKNPPFCDGSHGSL